MRKEGFECNGVGEGGWRFILFFPLYYYSGNTIIHNLLLKRTVHQYLRKGLDLSVNISSPNEFLNVLETCVYDKIVKEFCI